MKKNIKNITFKFLCLFAFAFSFISCKEVSEDGNKPALEVEGNKIIVSFAIDEKAKYINVFRREVKNLEAEDYADPFNIGQVIPEKDQQTSFTFVDALICKDVNYQYRVRYCMGDYYYLSNWSDVRSNPDAEHTFDSDFTTETGNCYLQYNSETSSLKVMSRGDDGINVKIGDPALIFSYKDKETTVSRVFALSIEEDKIKGPNGERLLKVGTPIDLRSLLTADFFSKEITLEGVIGEDVCKYGAQQEEVDDIKDVYGEKVYWSFPSKIEIKDEKGEDFGPLLEIKVETADNGHDYSLEGIENPIPENINSIDSQITSKEYFVSK